MGNGLRNSLSSNKNIVCKGGGGNLQVIVTSDKMNVFIVFHLTCIGQSYQTKKCRILNVLFYT